MLDNLQWRTLCPSNDRKYMVKGTELHQALFGPRSRYALIEYRIYDKDGHSDIAYRVRDAELVPDGVRPKIIFDGSWENLKEFVKNLLT